MTKQETKTCPACWEEILAVAKKCKHCWEVFKTEAEIEAEKNFKPIVFGKNTAIKILTICCWGFIALIFFIEGAVLWGSSSTPTTHEETIVNEDWEEEVIEVIEEATSESSGGGIAYFFGLLCLIPIWQLFMKKLIIDKDHVTIKKGIIFRKSEDIKYNKINNIGKSSFLGFWGIKIFTGNDKPVVFDNLESYEEVIDMINQKIDR